MCPNLRNSFWSRMGLQDADRDVCVRAIQVLYPEHTVAEVADQGYCSFTLSVAPPPGSSASSVEYIVQLRPAQHALDGGVAEAARRTYGALAPRMRSLQYDELPGGLRAVEMGRLEGTPLAKVDVGGVEWERQVGLVESFAECVARGWPAAVDDGSARCSRADTPTEGLWLDEHCTGKVGRVIVPKLRKLSVELPCETLRARAMDTLLRLLAIEHYPVVLNHGDLIPSNILVDEETWAVSGLVDWAEAEMLPFGTCLYGLEYLLGGLESTSSVDGVGMKPVWRYRQGSDALRNIFWQTLKKESPKIGENAEEVFLMRDVGVLLWFGYAWDEGAIDRVVNETDDTREVACLRAFFDSV
ncbi:uncharacterized protein CC84DRAFT_1251865 [Paraphaeosphaeria sporulosa]|uniref:Aminoglycoside phosphotransferase domain-containing protein n=1 Tax=Paraphaeosphaeria sporulosa TaxID=1460663 RepID=A0A177C2A6_9PLEO|nr:uncharacterized protein CC84DRAFT_1251865 [Paraphaeosphaeria sporulosa]OAG01924.1 hypothetical protein CC84DRAFT_1251865 [Paraphaeosphaeria sporulosa]